jgi:hypothetical protein
VLAIDCCSRYCIERVGWMEMCCNCVEVRGSARWRWRLHEKPVDVHTEHFASSSYLKAEVVVLVGDGISASTRERVFC